jgi:hypothetical protein
MRVDVRGDQATVALVSASNTASVEHGRITPRLTRLTLQIERGQWRINGFTESAAGTTAAG